MKGTKKFVHAIRKLHTPTTAIPGAAIGNTMRKSPWKVEAPSIQAASSSSKGTESRKFSTWLMKNFLDSVPFELGEAACIDVASPFQGRFSFVLRLASPGLVVVRS